MQRKEAPGHLSIWRENPGMKGIFQAGVGVVLAVAICPAARAQSHRHHAAPIVVSAPAGTRIIRTPQLASSSTLTNDGISGGFVVSGFAPDSVQTLLTGSFPVPGFGFDFTHFAAVNRDLGVRALIDPITQHELALARQIRRETPVFPIALPLFSNPTQVIIFQQPPVVVLQQPAAEEEPEARPERAHYAGPEAKLEPASPPQQVREAGEFVLVRRNGTLVFAVAFFTQSDRVVYVTREGIRRSLPLAEIDVDATLRMNEERGTTIRLPA